MGHAGGVNTLTLRTARTTRAPVRVGLAAAAALLSLAALAGCAGPVPVVTVTVPSPAASDPTATPATPSESAKPTEPSKPSTPAKPADPTNPADPAPALPTVGPGGASIVVTQGPVAPECTHTVCYLVHVTWTNLKPGAHDTQCVSDQSDPATWSQSTYNYPTADGERDLGCFLGKPGSRVWVVIDGVLESPHANWG